MRILILFFALCVASSALGAETQVRHGGYTKAYEDLAVVSVNYGFTADQLHFVVFECAQNRIKPHAILSITSRPGGQNVCSGYVKLPDGTKADLPGSKRIFEFTSGSFASEPINFTLGQLQSYLLSDPKPPTIDGLRRFLSDQQGHP